MTTKDLFRCIGNLSDGMIEEAADIKRKPRWLPIAALAACAVLAISIPLAVRNLGYKNADNASQAAGAETPTTESPASDEKTCGGRHRRCGRTDARRRIRGRRRLGGREFRICAHSGDGARRTAAGDEA